MPLELIVVDVACVIAPFVLITVSPASVPLEAIFPSMMPATPSMIRMSLPVAATAPAKLFAAWVSVMSSPAVRLVKPLITAAAV